MEEDTRLLLTSFNMRNPHIATDGMSTLSSYKSTSIFETQSKLKAELLSALIRVTLQQLRHLSVSLLQWRQ